MSRFLLCALGSAGDVHPFIVIAQALVARGHEVELITSPHFEERVRRAGIAFVPMGEAGDYERLLERPELWQPRGGARFIIDELSQRLPEAHAIVDARANKADTILVGSTLAWGMRVVQEARGLRGATIHLSPVCLQSAIEPPVLAGVGDLSWMPAWSVRLLQALVERVFIDRWIGPRLNALRGSLGLRPVRRIWSRWMHSPDLVIGAWPEWFAATQPDWPAQTRTSGFPIFREEGVDLDDALLAFLAAGPAPIGITPGSAMAHGKAFFEHALEACRATGHRVVVVTPYRDQLPEQLPEWVQHVAYAPFSALLPRLAALIHHGGIGTSAQALAAGIPQLIVPFAHDQFDNAARLRRLDVAKTLDLRRPVAVWSAALEELLADPEIHSAVRYYAGCMATEEPAAQLIARRLEALAMQDAAG